MLFKDYLNTDEGARLYENIKLDDATKEALAAWFGYRETIGARFYDFYRRELLISRDRYYSILRVETAKIDWTITEYLEEMAENEGTASGKQSSTKTGSKTGTASDTGNSTTTTSGSTTSTSTGKDTKTATTSTTDSKQDTTDSTTTVTGTDKGTRNTTGSGTQSSDESTDTTEKNVQALKQSPQSIAYGGATEGEIPLLDWQYMTTQQQSEKVGSVENSSNSSHSDTTKEETSATKNDSTTVKGTATTTGTTEGSASDITNTEGNTKSSHEDTSKTDTTSTRTSTDETTETDSAENSSADNSIRRAIRTGHNGELAEIFDRALRHIKGTSALAWLLGRLDNCFIMVYDYEGDEEDTTL